MVDETGDDANRAPKGPPTARALKCYPAPAPLAAGLDTGKLLLRERGAELVSDRLTLDLAPTRRRHAILSQFPVSMSGRYGWLQSVPVVCHDLCR